MGTFGENLAISEVGNTQSKAYQKVAADIPVESQIMSTGRDLTLDQASNVVREFVGIESEQNPQRVGFPITIVTIPKTGRAFSRTYKTDISPLSRLPKPKSGQPEKKKK